MIFGWSISIPLTNSQQTKVFKNSNVFFKTLGPGVLFASTAIGVSHLVQSTRAGAEYGFSLVVFVLLANIFKYPFFEFGSRYANATGKSLLWGYNRIGKKILILYLLITLLSMFTVVAAVTYVCVGLSINLFQLSIEPAEVSIALMFVCSILLLSGRFNMLDSLVKLVGFVLLISTLAAFLTTIWHGPIASWDVLMSPIDLSNETVFFIIALMGWMPTAIDLSTWNSIWTIERIKQTDYLPSMKQTLYEFNVGYWISAALSLCFLSLGAYIMYGMNTSLSENAATFSNQLIGLFTTTLGSGSYYLIAIASFSIMFSTCITVYDGYARAMSETSYLLLGLKSKMLNTYKVWLIIVLVGAFVVINNFIGNFKQLIDLATIISFLIAPIIAVVNYKLVCSDDLSDEHKPGIKMKILSILGILYLLLFSALFVALKFNWIQI